uniref:Chaperone NapD n=1 Tax=Magnetococcus massalia (strain MO-1) TaxID=451514 RepID=A0A1S7LF66_MAGMO|nr:putative assembly protein NapD for periplasmic nitrate reductase [Candidatus Magnetococcus massalia]
MNLLSAVVNARPEALEEVKSTLTAMDGVELHIDGGDGRLVITVESDQYREVADRIQEIHDMKGVLSANPVYQYADPKESDQVANDYIKEEPVDADDDQCEIVHTEEEMAS